MHQVFGFILQLCYHWRFSVSLPEKTIGLFSRFHPFFGHALACGLNYFHSFCANDLKLCEWLMTWRCSGHFCKIEKKPEWLLGSHLRFLQYTFLVHQTTFTFYSPWANVFKLYMCVTYHLRMLCTIFQIEKTVALLPFWIFTNTHIHCASNPFYSFGANGVKLCRRVTYDIRMLCFIFRWKQMAAILILHFPYALNSVYSLVVNVLNICRCDTYY